MPDKIKKIKIKQVLSLLTIATIVIQNIFVPVSPAYALTEDSTYLTVRVIPADSQAPAAITDLVAQVGSSEGEINLSWTAVGDDGYSGNIANGE
ncbi:MAG: hypothetical protein ABII74_01600 [Elusimicrobiota bacterium]